jgi:hypothetical protein
VHIPLPKQAGHSLLRHPKNTSRIINGGSAVKVDHWLGRWDWHCGAAHRFATCVWIALCKINSARRKRRIHIRISKKNSVPFSINLHTNSPLLFACLSNAELIMDLRCYLGLAYDDWRCVLEDDPLPCHLITRVEELEIGAVSFELLATLLHQGVKGKFDDVVLVDVRSVGARVSPFMLDMREVVDSPAESPKSIDTRIKQEAEAPARNYRNQTVRFHELDGLILSGPTAIRGVAGLQRGASPSTKRRLDSGEAGTMTALEVGAVASRFKCKKITKRRKIG